MSHAENTENAFESVVRLDKIMALATDQGHDDAALFALAAKRLIEMWLVDADPAKLGAADKLLDVILTEFPRMTTIRVTQPDGTVENFDDFDVAWDLFSTSPGASWTIHDPAYLARFAERN